MNAAFVAALVLAVGTVAQPAPATELVSIDIVDAPRPLEKWGFAPSTRRVDPGTWITWSNAGADAHSVTSVAGDFDSGELQPSEGFSWYFDQPGTYAYACTLHPWMAGKIVVSDQLSAISHQQSAISQPTPNDAPIPDSQYLTAEA